MVKLTTFDKQLLDLIQKDFPLVERPFLNLADKLQTAESAVIARLKLLKKNHIIRQISPIFDTGRMGYHSSLVAFRVDPKRLKPAIEIINRHPGVSHNYLRDNRYNLWFTLAVPPGKDLEREIIRLRRKTGAQDALILPSQRTFKIGVFLGFSRAEKTPERGRSAIGPPRKHVLLSDTEKNIIRVTQENLPLTKRPFAVYAETLNLSVAELLAALDDLKRTAVMRRFAAILHHNEAGYDKNVMVVWNIPEKDINRVCRHFITYTNISHCYQRPVYETWPWNIYTMIHAQSTRTIDAIIRETTDRFPGLRHMKLKTLRELKKVRIRYFTE